MDSSLRLEWRDLNYKVTVDAGGKKFEKQILKGLSGVAEPGMSRSRACGQVVSMKMPGSQYWCFCRASGGYHGPHWQWQDVSSERTGSAHCSLQGVCFP